MLWCFKLCRTAGIPHWSYPPGSKPHCRTLVLSLAPSQAPCLRATAISASAACAAMRKSSWTYSEARWVSGLRPLTPMYNLVGCVAVIAHVLIAQRLLRLSNDPKSKSSPRSPSHAPQCGTLICVPSGPTLPKVDADPELNKANLSDSLLLRTLWAKLPPQGAGENVDLGPCKHMLRVYAKWHLHHLGASSTRLSVMHVHAFLLTGILQVGQYVR